MNRIIRAESIIDQKALLAVLKKLSGSGTARRTVSDAMIAEWLNEKHQTTIQKMRKGERRCKFSQEQWQHAYQMAFNNYNGMEKIYVRTIDQELKAYLTNDASKVYANDFYPLYEKFISTVDLSISAREDYVNAIIAKAFNSKLCTMDVLNVLKKLSGEANVEVTDACLGEWLEVDPTSVQKMRTGSRTCTINLTQFLKAFDRAFERYAGRQFTYAETIDAEIRNALANERKQLYLLQYQPLYEEFLQNAGNKKDTHRQYVRAIVSTIYGIDRNSARDKKDDDVWLDDVIFHWQQEGVPFDLECTGSSYAIVGILDGRPGQEIYVFFLSDGLDIYCSTSSICRPERTYSTLDSICHLNNSLQNRKQLTLTLDKDDNLVAYGCLRNPSSPGKTCLAVLMETKSYVQHILSIFAEENDVT